MPHTERDSAAHATVRVVAILVCLVVVIGSCSSGGDENPPPSNGTPKGTYNISVQGKSGNMTVPTVVTLVVN